MTAQGFPSAAAPLVDARGNITPAWLRFLTVLFSRTGGPQGMTPADYEAQIANAQTTANAAQTAATAASLAAADARLAAELADAAEATADPLLTLMLSD